MRKTRGCCWGRGARRVTACHSHCLRTGPRPAYLSTCTSAPATTLPTRRRTALNAPTPFCPLSLVHHVSHDSHVKGDLLSVFFFLVRVKDLKS